MSFKDRFDRLIDYFTEDGDECDVQKRLLKQSVLANL